MFFSNTVHEVVARKRPDKSIRIFFGFRLTKLATPLFPENRDAYDTFGVPKIPSGQTPHMYSSNHWSYPLNRKNLVKWSGETFIESVLREKLVKSTGETCTVVPLVCPSLAELDLMATYPPYTKEDLAILQPVSLL